MAHPTDLQLPHPSHSDEGHTGAIYVLKVRDPYLVSGSADKTIRIWDINTDRLLRILSSGHESSITSLHFDAHPEKDIIISADADGNILVWRFSTGAILQRLTSAHQSSIPSLTFNSDVLATGGRDTKIRLWTRLPPAPSTSDPPAPENILSTTNPTVLHGHTSSVNSLCFIIPDTEDENKLLSGSGDHSILLWDLPTHSLLQRILIHDQGITDLQIAATAAAGGRFLISTSSDHTARIFDLSHNT
jgi:F-box and WD-40 domain protein 1/11